MPRWIDLPPVWLAGFALLVLAQARMAPLGGFPPALGWIGWGLIGAGAVLMALAAREFLRARTTIVPHRPPRALVTGGVFAHTRNPIYLGDALVLAGVVLIWGDWPGLLAVPAFCAVITARFIKPEEGRLRAAFPDEFDAWAGRVRRWL